MQQLKYQTFALLKGNDYQQSNKVRNKYSDTFVKLEIFLFSFI